MKALMYCHRILPAMSSTDSSAALTQHFELCLKDLVLVLAEIKVSRLIQQRTFPIIFLHTWARHRSISVVCSNVFFGIAWYNAPQICQIANNESSEKNKKVPLSVWYHIVSHLQLENLKRNCTKVHRRTPNPWILEPSQHWRDKHQS